MLFIPLLPSKWSIKKERREEKRREEKRREEKRREEGEEEEEEKSEGKGGTIEEKRENISDINRYSPWSLEIESNGVLAAARELGVAIVAYPNALLFFLYLFISSHFLIKFILLCRLFCFVFEKRKRYSPLGRGFLSGQIKSLDDFKDPSDYRKHMPRFALSLSSPSFLHPSLPPSLFLPFSFCRPPS